jgi:hypothetical protein
MKIFKYPLTLTDKQTILLPIGAELLTIQNQNGSLCLWASVDEKAFLEARTFAIYGTGNPLPESIGRYISTVQMDGFVWHIFEIDKP